MLAAVAVAVVLALGLWLLLVRTPDGATTTSTEPSGRALTPTFPPDTSSSAPETGASIAAGSASASASAFSGDTATTAPEPTTSASLSDRVGDRTLSADPAPAWADLAGATLTRSGAGYELRVRLGGGAAPATTDPSHTMNIASFYDIDGDGSIDYEVWANLAEGGWGASYSTTAPDSPRSSTSRS